MSLIAKGGGDFVPCPEGLHLCCCVDVVDKGLVDTQYGEKHKVVLVWETDKRMEDGKPFTVRRMYTFSLHPKSSLHKDLVAWRGQPFTAEQLKKGFDVEKVIGTCCQILVKHADRDGQIWADVAAIMKAPNGQKLTPSGNYKRVKDREPEEDAFGRRAGDDSYEDSGYPEDEPFRLPAKTTGDPIPF
jgi:hypothetical protein